MSSPNVSVLLCQHTPDNVERLVNAIPDPNDPTYYTAIELAYDDTDPTNDARRRVGQMQLEAQRYMAGVQTDSYYLRKEHFYGAFIAAALKAERSDLKLLFVDAGRTTNGEENLEKVTKGFGMAAITEAWNDSMGDPVTYITRRGADIAESLNYREPMVAEQIESILQTNGNEPMSVIVGANHYGLLPQLEHRGIAATAVVVDRPSNTCEMAVANMIRRGKQFDTAVLAAMGLAEWITPEHITSGDVFMQLRGKDPAAVLTSAKMFYEDPSISYKSLPVF